MSSLDSGNDAILANQYETLILENADDNAGGLQIHVHSPSPTGSGDMENQMLQYIRPKTFRKLSNASSIISEIFRHPEAREDGLRVKIKQANERDNTKDLIEFLRTTSPPPHNHIFPSRSISKSSGKKKRVPFWAICRKLKARKGKKKGEAPSAPPALLRLPDSAVAGRTTDGHRHIAISIPIGDANLENAPISSAPVRPIASPLIRADRVPARISSAPGRTTNSGRTKENKKASASEYNLQTTTSKATINAVPASFSERISKFEHARRPRTTDQMSRQHRNSVAGFTSAKSIADTHDHRLANKRSYTYSAVDIHESPDGVSVSRHHHWNWPSDSDFGFRHSSVDDMVMNKKEAMVANALSLHGYPQSVSNLSPDLSEYGTEKCSPAIDPRRGQSLLTFPNMGMALTSDLKGQNSMAQMSYHELINHGPDSSGSEDGGVARTQTLRSLTFDIPPAYQLPRREMNKSKTSSPIQEPDAKPALRFTPVMTVTDIQPSISMESLDEEGLTMPGSTGTSRAPISSPVSLTDDNDGELTPKASEQLLHQPSIEQLLNSNRNSHLVDIASPTSNIRGVASGSKSSRCPPIRLPSPMSPRRPESHQALAKRYDELRKSRDEELDVLLERVEKLESRNEWWLNSMVPMVESMSRRLTRVYDDKSLSRLTRTRERIQNMAVGDARDSKTAQSQRLKTPIPSATATEDRTRSSRAQDYTRPLSLDLDHDHGLNFDSISPLPTPREVQPVRYHYGHHEPQSRSSIESFDSFDSFNINHGIKIAPPTREPSPYPYPYIYPGESVENLHRQIYEQGQGQARDDDFRPLSAWEAPKQNRKSRDILGAGIRQCSYGSACSGSGLSRMNLELPGEEMNMSATSTGYNNQDWDFYGGQRLQRHDSIGDLGGEQGDYGYGTAGHGTGVPVDRLPSRHGERGLLNNTMDAFLPRPKTSVGPQQNSSGFSEYSAAAAATGAKSRPSTWPTHQKLRKEYNNHHQVRGLNAYRISGNYAGVEEEEEDVDTSLKSYRNRVVQQEERGSRGRGQQRQRQEQGRRQTEWDTLETLMRGLTETTRLDLNLGRGLDLGFTESS